MSTTNAHDLINDALTRLHMVAGNNDLYLEMDALFSFFLFKKYCDFKEVISGVIHYNESGGEYTFAIGSTEIESTVPTAALGALFNREIERAQPGDLTLTELERILTATVLLINKLIDKQYRSS